jgi:formylglycine-generating enzyme required for sulfatase activity
MKKREVEPAQNETVSLKPVFGVPPTTYVPALLGLGVLIILFLVLVNPGIRNNGARVTFESVPEGASVRVDGTRVGATPVEVFIEKGEHSVTLVKPFFEERTVSITVPGRLVGSLFFPRKITVSERLEVTEPRALAETAAQDFNRWAMVGEANAQYQFRPALSAAIIDLTAGNSSGTRAAAAEGPRSRNAIVGDLTEDLLSHAVRDVHSEALLKDYLRALALEESGGGAPGALQAVGMLARLSRAFERNPALVHLAAAALPERLSESFRSSAWYDRTTGDLVTRVLAATEEGGPAVPELSRISVAGQVFVEIPARRFVMGPQAGARASDNGGLTRPYVAEVDRFFLMETEVTRRLYQRFIKERPRWAPEGRSELVSGGLATEHYLADWSDGSSSDQSSRPVRYVSYHAAVAFCEWMEEQLPPALSGFQVRLPTEPEWEWATILNASEGYEAVFADAAMSTPLPVGSSEPGRLGIYDLLGNVWEWTADWYHPGAYLVEEEAPFPGTQRVVRGGSWANDRRSVTTTTRGSQPPEWCTPFLGFRPVIVEADQ